MEFNNIIFISDMDETLFDNNKQISKKNLNAIQNFQEKGGLFTLATGRSITGCNPYVAKLHIHMPVILYNGSCIYDYNKNRILWVRTLPDIIHSYVEELMYTFPGMGIQIMTEKGVYSFCTTPVYEAFMKRECLLYKKVSKMQEVMGNWIKVEMTSDTVNQRALDHYLEETIPKGIRWLTTGRYSRELVFEEVSKGAAIRAYRKVLGLGENTICCIGDHNNDYEMILEADISFAVENALDKIKDTVDYIVNDNNHHAVADAMSILGRI